MNSLTKQDVITLLEALESWEKQPGADAFSGSLLSIMFGAIAPDGKDELKQMSVAEEAKAKEATYQRKLQTAELRLKLIRMQETTVAEELLTGVK